MRRYDHHSSNLLMTCPRVVVVGLCSGFLRVLGPTSGPGGTATGALTKQAYRSEAHECH